MNDKRVVPYLTPRRQESLFRLGRSPDFASSSRSLPVQMHSGFERSSA